MSTERTSGTYLLDGRNAGGFELEDPINGPRQIVEFYELGYRVVRDLDSAYDGHESDVERLENAGAIRLFASDDAIASVTFESGRTVTREELSR